MGEGSKSELVTVQPLTRGTGNHDGPNSFKWRKIWWWTTHSH